MPKSALLAKNPISTLCYNSRSAERAEVGALLCVFCGGKLLYRQLSHLYNEAVAPINVARLQYQGGHTAEPLASQL
jgi:hypothetical protein